MATLQQLERLYQNPNVRKFLDLLSYTEGTQGNGYHTAFGGGRLSSLADHPRYLKSFKQTNGKTNKTSAAGRYQFLTKTWDNLAKQYGFKDFGEKNQDLGAIALLIQNGAMPHIVKGNWGQAVAKAGGTWASLPSSPHPQPTKSWKKVNEFLGGQITNPPPQKAGTNSVLAGNNGGHKPQTPSQLLVGIMGDYRLGDTGSGSGDHYDLRARDKNGKRVDINPYLDRFFVDGKALNTYKQTGRYMEARKGYYHQGVDFGFNGSFGGKQSARQLFINPAFADQVAGVSSHFDKGSKGRSGGWYTKITFKDGVSVNVLHQNQKNMAQINQGWQGWQQNRQGQMGQQETGFSPQQITGDRLQSLLRLNGITSQSNQPATTQSTPFAPQKIMGDRLQQLLQLNGIGATQPQEQPPTPIQMAQQTAKPFTPQQITGDRLQNLLKLNGV